MAAQQPQKPRGLPNPYAAKGLPNPYALATVAESAPVRFSDEQTKAEQKKTPASTFVQPHTIKRPQQKAATKKKPVMARPVVVASTADAAPAAATATSQQPGLDWWRSTEDDDAAALAWKQERDRTMKERKKLEKKFAKQYGYWKPDAPYKAEKPSNLRAYRATGAYRYKLDAFNEHVKNSRRTPRAPTASTTAVSQPAPSSTSNTAAPDPKRFLPPIPPIPGSPPPPPSPPSDPPSIPPPPSAIDLTAAVPPPPPPPPPPEIPAATPPPPPTSSGPYNPTISAPPVRYNPTISAPPVHYANATISAPPVRYDVSNDQAAAYLLAQEEPPPERPVKKPRISKAEAMMAKMGWSKGQGLGKNNDGIITHLEVKARKNDRRVNSSDDYDDDNGMVIKSQQVFDILGGHSTKRKEPDRFGEESRVVVAWGCVDGIDWTADANRDDGGIRQEMGQIFDSKFGRVERIFVNMDSEPPTVYIKFASELSALNAVNRFHEGYKFRDREIRALYYSEAKFEASIFEH